MKITKILQSKNYTTIMYLLTIIFSLLIIFNLVDILNQTNQEISESLLKKSRLTGYVISNQTNQPIAKNITNQNQTQEQAELYSETSYFIYYVLILTILTFIIFIATTIILPRIKHLTWHKFYLIFLNKNFSSGYRIIK